VIIIIAVHTAINVEKRKNGIDAINPKQIRPTSIKRVLAITATK